MSDRPSLRHGLPYRWWRSEEFVVGLVAILSLLMFLVMASVVFALYIGKVVS